MLKLLENQTNQSIVSIDKQIPYVMNGAPYASLGEEFRIDLV